MRRSLFCAAAAVALTAVSAFGGTISVDEYGNLFINGVKSTNGVLGTDPGPGGLANVLIYTLPFMGAQGDVHLMDPVSPGDPCSGNFCDVIRFNGDGTLIFYSDNVDGFDAPADTPSAPHASYTNIVTIPEVGPEGLNGAMYAPTGVQPGADPNFLPTYTLISDSPEPGTLLLALAGFGALAVRRLATRRSR